MPTATTPPPASSSPGQSRSLPPVALWVLGLIAAALFVPRLAGPFNDGQRGNCGAMFALMERNERALGWATTYGVPVLNPVPPADSTGPLETYSHHPPGLPWAVMLAARLPGDIETTSRLVALLLTLCSCWLAADLAARLAGARAGFAAGLLMLLLPAGLHHGLLVNYETITIPAMLFLTRALVLDRGQALLAGLLAGLADWFALLPLLLMLRRAPPRRWFGAAVGGALMILMTFALAAQVTPASPGETLTQALAATFLGPQFDPGAWASNMATHLWTLYSLALIPAALAVVFLARMQPALGRLLRVLLACGLGNVVVFAHHATSHEHFSLVLLPYIALSTATLLFPRRDQPGGWPLLPSLALVVILGAGALAAWNQWPQRQNTSQAERADALAQVSDLSHLYLFPEGVPLVFLHRAERHVWPGPVSDLGSARLAAQAYGLRFGTPSLPGQLVLEGDATPPPWVLDLGPGEPRGRFMTWEIPLPPGP